VFDPDTPAGKEEEEVEISRRAPLVAGGAEERAGLLSLSLLEIRVYGAGGLSQIPP
jgi:hypothetical protein